MSSLWTPGGEVPVERGGTPSRPGPPPERTDPLDPSELAPEEREDLAREIAAMQQRLLGAPAADVLASHLVQVANLAYLHLAQEQPRFTEAALAIDALAGAIAAASGRLGENEDTLQEAVQTLQTLFVQRKDQLSGGAEASGTPGNGSGGVGPEPAAESTSEDNPWG